MNSKPFFCLMLLLSVALAGCPDDEDDTGTDMGPRDVGAGDDTGVDSGAIDTGLDSSVPDTGLDSSVPDTGDDNCLINETVDVDGTNVVVDPATTRPVTGGATEAVLSCRNPPDPEFVNGYCLVECVDFLGYTPSQQEVRQLEVAAFPLFDVGAMRPIDSDPTYDHQTGIDHDPMNRAPVGYNFTSPPNTECPSGWQLELGWLGGAGGGDETMASETPYVLRVRSVQTATPAWIDTYHWGFIRRNDEVPETPACGINEPRVPGIRYSFPVIHRSMVQQGVESAGETVPGSANLVDGLGSGYAVLEARDCSSGGGQPMQNATLGLTPTPIRDVYLGDAHELNRTALFTSKVGQWFAIGFVEMTATSSMSLDVTAAAGVTSDGTCTEAFAGSSFPIYPDAVTFFRFSRENSIIE